MPWVSRYTCVLCGVCYRDTATLAVLFALPARGVGAGGEGGGGGTHRKTLSNEKRAIFPTNGVASTGVNFDSQSSMSQLTQLKSNLNVSGQSANVSCNFSTSSDGHEGP